MRVARGVDRQVSLGIDSEISFAPTGHIVQFGGIGDGPAFNASVIIWQLRDGLNLQAGAVNRDERELAFQARHESA